MCSDAAVELGVEVLGAETGEDVMQVGVGGDTGERVALEPLPRLEEARRKDPGSAGAFPRSKARLRLLREVEAVGG